MASNTHFITALKAGTALAFFAATPALAQTAEQAAASESPRAEDNALDTGEEIIVTARRVEESLLTVPASVSAFNERALERIQAQDTTALQGAVPNLNIVQGRGSSNATNIFIRGIGQPDALQTFDPAVGFYVDDVYYSRIRGTQLDLLDVERIEVLRGPQGTLYGKNTIGGALKVVTRKPGQEFHANASVAYGSYDQFEMKGSASGPISDTVAVGAGILISKRDGYVEDRVLDRDYNDKNTAAVRGAIAFTPSSRFRFDLTADYSHDDAAMNVGAPLNDLTYLLGGVSLPLAVDPEDYDYTARTSPELPNETKLRHWGISGTAVYDVTDALSLKSITAYRELNTDDYIDIDATQLQVGDVLVAVDQRQVSQELQLTYDSGPVQFVGGLYYLKEDVASHQEAYGDDVLGSLPLFCVNCTFFRSIDDDLSTTSFAAYANATYAITDALSLSGGLRWTREEKDYDRITDPDSSLPLPAVNNPYAFEAKDSWKDLSPMASIDYQFGPDTMAYARYAKGFKSGGFNGRANSVAESTTYRPEEVDSFEVGLKTAIAGQLRASFAAFYNDYKNFQARVSTTDPSQGIDLPQLSVFNAGKLVIKGAEAELNWTPLPRLLLDAQVGYLDAEYEEFVDERFPDDSRAFQTPAFAPDWTLRFGAQYGFDLGATGTLTVGGQSRYRSEVALAVDNTLLDGTPIEGLFQEAYWLHDARIVWEDPSRTYSIGLYGQNLSDKVYKTDGQEFSSVGNIRTVYFGAPRTFTLRATVRY